MTELYVSLGLIGVGLVWAALMQRRIPHNVVINGYFYRVFLILLTLYFAYMLFTQDIQFAVLRIALSALGLFTLYGVIESFRFKLYFDDEGFRYRDGLRWKEHRYTDILNISHIKRDKSARSLFYEMEGSSFSISEGMHNAAVFYEHVRTYSALNGLKKLEGLDN